MRRVRVKNRLGSERIGSGLGCHRPVRWLLAAPAAHAPGHRSPSHALHGHILPQSSPYSTQHPYPQGMRRLLQGCKRGGLGCPPPHVLHRLLRRILTFAPSQAGIAAGFVIYSWRCLGSAIRAGHLGHRISDFHLPSLRLPIGPSFVGLVNCRVGSTGVGVETCWPVSVCDWLRFAWWLCCLGCSGVVLGESLLRLPERLSGRLTALDPSRVALTRVRPVPSTSGALLSTSALRSPGICSHSRGITSISTLNPAKITPQPPSSPAIPHKMQDYP